MKVTTVREIVQKNGSKTTITIEDNMSDADTNQLNRHLEIVGFYNSESLITRFRRFYRGKNNV
jgi:hypothetical protein